VVDRYRHQHENMIALAEDILSIAASGDAGKADALGRARLDFSRAVNEHCREESVTVGAAVAKGLLRAEVVSEMARVVMLWRAEVALCNSEWPTRRVFDHPADFIRRFRPLVDGLRREAERENRIILPVLQGRMAA
jgi:hypothetical protein